jgi:hypothetical protein
MVVVCVVGIRGMLVGVSVVLVGGEGVDLEGRHWRAWLLVLVDRSCLRVMLVRWFHWLNSDRGQSRLAGSRCELLWVSIWVVWYGMDTGVVVGVHGQVVG